MSNGSTPSRKNSSYWDDGTIPWVKTGEVNNKLIFDTSEHITEHALERTSVHLLPKDTVIMALYGSGTAGRLALLRSPSTTNQACTAMICESSSEAFYLFVVLKRMYHEIDNLTRGSVQQNLSKEIVANLRVPNARKDVLDSLGFNVIYSQIAFSEAETLNLSKLRDALLPKLMSGEIDVSKVDLMQPTNNHLEVCRNRISWRCGEGRGIGVVTSRPLKPAGRKDTGGRPYASAQWKLSVPAPISNW